MTHPMTERAGSTPVLIGVGQHSERLGEDDYRGLSPVDLAARAAVVALADAGVAAAEIDLLACPRQFDESFPGIPAALGRPDNFTRAVARRLGADPARCIYSVAGGQSPQQLVTEFAGEIAAGRTRVALVVTSEAISTVLTQVSQPDPPDLTEITGIIDEDRGAGLGGIVTRTHVAHQLIDAPTQYALFENARRARLGQTRAEQAVEMGRWFAPFTRIAAENPHSAVRTVRTGAELMTVTDNNRVIVDPYPKAVVAREKVNQSAAVLITSEEVAEQLGVPREQWVYLRGHSDLRDRDAMLRADLSRSEPSLTAIDESLAMAGIDVGDVASFDLYSCFPVAVSTVAEGLGLSPEDPRGLTVTGGLPFFGGPGNGYSLHAIVETVVRCRRTPGAWGMVGANGGMLSKYSVGVYSTTPGGWEVGDDAALQARLDAAPDVPVAVVANGPATVETWTVKYDGPQRRAVVVGRLDDGRRFLANNVEGDDELIDLLLGDGGPGARIQVRSVPEGNRVAVSLARMDELVPRVPVGFRDSYRYAEIQRQGHVLEITLTGTDDRNLLDAAAHHELAGLFDAFEADRELRVAILTGAGTTTFAATSDLDHPIAALDANLPASGLAGLTHRRLTKPVIAALNGNALGGALEIALACHLVVAEEHVELGLPHARMGSIAASGGLVRLPRLVPANVANRMILTGVPISAVEAERWGLVARVVPPGDALKGARELAAEILLGAPGALRSSLEVMAAAGSLDDAAALKLSGDRLERLLISNDAAEAFVAGFEGRPPVWRNH
ncbi:MAG: putative enoyl-CoA hydratase [Marmoricola sp.]|nr:putative enoyl-CoA hydratase [Marmoricola sp.]